MKNTTITHRCIIDPTVFSVPVSGAAAALIACCAAIARVQIRFQFGRQRPFGEEDLCQF